MTRYDMLHSDSHSRPVSSTANNPRCGDAIELD